MALCPGGGGVGQEGQGREEVAGTGGGRGDGRAGANGEGAPGDPKNNAPKLGSIVDPSYLALISDQDLRSITIAGLPDRNMPDWRTDAAQPLAQPLTDQQLTDIITWLVSHRAPNPGQPYPTPEKQPAGAAQ